MPQPLAPLQPMMPMRPMVPMQPLTPLRPGETRQRQGGSSQPQPEWQQQVPAPSPVYEPPPPPPMLQQFVQQFSPPPVFQPSAPLRTTIATTTSTMAWPTAGRRRSGGGGGGGGGKAAAIIGAVVAAIVGLAAIGSTKPHSTKINLSIPPISVSIPPVNPGGGSQQTTTHQSSGGGIAHLGQSLELNGSASGESARMTFTRWVDVAHPKNTFMDSPGSGKRLAAAEFQILNTGSFVYVASPSDGAWAIDNHGRKYKAAFMFGGLHEGRILGPAVSLQTGHSTLGFVAFDVPKTAKISEIEMSEASGYGQIGVWSIKR